MREKETKREGEGNWGRERKRNRRERSRNNRSDIGDEEEERVKDTLKSSSTGKERRVALSRSLGKSEFSENDHESCLEG